MNNLIDELFDKETIQDDMMSPGQLAAYLGVSIELLNNWRMNSKGPAFLKFPGHIRYARSDVRIWLHKIRTDPSTKPTMTAREFNRALKLSDATGQPMEAPVA